MVVNLIFSWRFLSWIVGFLKSMFNNEFLVLWIYCMFINFFKSFLISFIMYFWILWINGFLDFNNVVNELKIGNILCKKSKYILVMGLFNCFVKMVILVFFLFLSEVFFSERYDEKYDFKVLYCLRILLMYFMRDNYRVLLCFKIFFVSIS